jgi:D-arginine dehydrogenase
LSKRCSVVLVERETHPAMHATGRSAATYIPSYRAENPALRLLTRASGRFLKSPPEGFAENALLKPRGLLTLLKGVDGASSSQELADLNALLEDPIVMLPVSDVRRRLPELSAEWLSDAWWEADVHDIDVHGLHQGYLKVLRENGGRIVLAELACPRFENGAWQISVADEYLEAPVVVNAAGAWADELAESANVARLGLQPKRRTAILVSPPVHCDVTDWPVVLAYDESFYFKPDAGMLLVSPVDAHESPPCDAQPEEIDMAYAADFATQAINGLEVKRISHSWAGLRTFASDETPVIGFDTSSPGFFWCVGQGGHGIQIAPAVAKLSAAMISGDDNTVELSDLGFLPEWVSPSRLSRIGE